MRSWWLEGAAAALVLLTSPNSARGQDASDRIAADLPPRVRVEGRSYPTRSLEDWMREHNLPAVSVAVIDEGRIVWSRAWGVADAAAGTAATEQTRFMAGSLSKPVAAVVALDLVEDGILSLDAPVNPALKRWRVPDDAATAGQPITLRSLLDHTSGLPADTSAIATYALGETQPAIEDVLGGVGGRPETRPVSPPGSASRYTSSGYTLAQLLMEDVTGRTFADLALSRVFAPLGMTSSTYDPPAPGGPWGDFALGHGGDGRPVAGGLRVSPEHGAAGLFTTPTDLARLLVALQDSFAGTGATPLEQASAVEMTRVALAPYGLGFGVEGEGDDLALSLGGQATGFHSLIISFPNRRQGLVALANGARGDDVIIALASAIAEAYGWPSFRPVLIRRGTVDPERLAQAAGVYRLDQMTATVGVASDGISLSARFSPEDAFELIPQDGDFYLESTLGLPVRLQRDSSGAVIGMQFGGRRLARVSP